MRVLCVGRHAFLSEHLCRYFSELGAECESAVGTGAVAGAAARFEPHLVVSEGDLLTPALLDDWSHDATLAGTPVLAVSMTNRPENGAALSAAGGVVYLPALDREQGLALLAGAFRPRGVQSPDWRMPQPSPGVVR
jgi:hypothetical protein